MSQRKPIKTVRGCKAERINRRARKAFRKAQKAARRLSR